VKNLGSPDKPIDLDAEIENVQEDVGPGPEAPVEYDELMSNN
jgi:hypothetical protein